MTKELTITCSQDEITEVLSMALAGISMLPEPDRTRAKEKWQAVMEEVKSAERYERAA